jgi:hypothetical protein
LGVRRTEMTITEDLTKKLSVRCDMPCDISNRSGKLKLWCDDATRSWLESWERCDQLGPTSNESARTGYATHATWTSQVGTHADMSRLNEDVGTQLNDLAGRLDKYVGARRVDLVSCVGVRTLKVG